MVPARLNDLYNGIELTHVLNIMKLLNENNFDAAIEEVKSQDHSGMSWGLIRAMLKDLGGNGPKFAEIMRTIY